MGTEDAIVFTTGYQANVGCIGTILGPGDTVICDSGDHASILDGCRLSGAKLRPFRHNRMDKLEKMLRAGRRRTAAASWSSSTASSRWRATSATCRGSSSSASAYGARLMVDEAHGAGVLGARGAGACELFGLEDEVDLRMGTFSKSLASCGGFIAGPADVIEYLRVSSRSFIFSASRGPGRGRRRAGGAAGDPRRGPGAVRARCSPTPSTCARGCADLGLQVIEPGTLPDGTVATTPVVPVVVGDDWQAVLLWKALFDAGVYTNVAIHPAVPPGGALLRTSLMATHEREHLDGALGDDRQRVIRDFPDLPARLNCPVTGI